MRPTILALSSSSEGSSASVFTPFWSRSVAPHRSTEDHEFLVSLGVLDRHLGGGDRIHRSGDGDRPLEEVHKRCVRRAFESNLGDAVFGDPEGSTRSTHLPAQSAHLRNRHSAIVGYDHHAGLSEDASQRLDHRGFFAPSTARLQFFAKPCRKLRRRSAFQPTGRGAIALPGTFLSPFARKISRFGTYPEAVNRTHPNTGFAAWPFKPKNSHSFGPSPPSMQAD